MLGKLPVEANELERSSLEVAGCSDFVPCGRMHAGCLFAFMSVVAYSDVVTTTPGPPASRKLLRRENFSPASPGPASPL